MYFNFARKPLGLALLAAFALPAGAAGLPTLQEVTVSGGGKNLVGVADTAGEGTVTGKQLANRPLLRPAEVLEAVPGLIVTQHSGDGKANQYFLRGFNLDHGSDFATTVLGMPVNMRTHAHGQGYMDLNFLIPELVSAVRYRKGVYAAEDGDFVTAGSSRIDYQRQLPASFVDVGLGQHNFRRLLAAGSHTFENGYTLLSAAEVSGYDGPWTQAQNLEKHNAVFRFSEGTASNGLALTAMFYRADWTATEHVPQRAIASGEIGRYAPLGANDGGQTHRYSLSGEWARSGQNSAQKANAYVIDYGLNLFSGPSGYIGSVNGDQHEQADRRIVWGGAGEQRWFLGPNWRDSEFALGADFRQDRIAKLGLYRTENRRRSETVREDRVLESSLGLYAELRTQWQDWLRTTVGLRHDQLRAQAKALAGANNGSNGGEVDAAQTSPKLGVVFGPFNLLGPSEFYANWGHGFHSNDVRGATARVNPQDGSAAEPVPLIVKAKGSEVGVRVNPLPGWNSSLTLWQKELASELVFIGDEGVTEPKGTSRRHGVEWSNYYAPGSGLILDADLAWSQARFQEPVGGGRYVPNAIPLTASLGVGFDAGGAWFGGLRLRYLGAYALEESGTQKSQAFWMTSLKLGYRVSSTLQFTLDVLNLFDRKANDIEYWGGACTRSEALAGTGGCGAGGSLDGRLVHPLEPRALRLGMRVLF